MPRWYMHMIGVILPHIIRWRVVKKQQRQWAFQLNVIDVWAHDDTCLYIDEYSSLGYV
jgi:hypothetical protein